MMLFMRTFLWMLFQGAIVAVVAGFILSNGPAHNPVAAGIIGMVCAALVTAIIFELRLLPFRISRLVTRASKVLRREPRSDGLSLPRTGGDTGQLAEQFRRPRISHDGGDVI
jgi:hypothetical protein